MASINGVNMNDVKTRNRCSILELVYRYSGIPRKLIAKKLGLTPAAITLLTNELIDEGILYEADKVVSGNRGRREISLEIRQENFVTIGISFTRHHVEIICINLKLNILFQKSYQTSRFNGQPDAILTFAIERVQEDILNAHILTGQKLLGIGISVLGIVDSSRGISTNSYGVFNGSPDLVSPIENAFHVPAYLTNNICACTHGEAFQSNSSGMPGRLLFIKYGPGIGAAMLTSEDFFNIHAYSAVQMAHVIMDPYGRPCICGNHGCLETIISYDSIIQSISDLITPNLTPELYDAAHKNPGGISIADILSSYDKGDSIVVNEMNRVVFYLTLAIRNAITLLNPDVVVLYGETFTNRKFRRKILNELNSYTNTKNVLFSEFNLQLEALGPATIAISHFFLRGGCGV